MEKTSGNQMAMITHQVNVIYLSFVVPFFNKEASIPLFCNEAVKIYTLTNDQFEIIFVDDDSSDNIFSILRQFANQDKQVHYVSLHPQYIIREAQ